MHTTTLNCITGANRRPIRRRFRDAHSSQDDRDGDDRRQHGPSSPICNGSGCGTLSSGLRTGPFSDTPSVPTTMWKACIAILNKYDV